MGSPAGGGRRLVGEAVALTEEATAPSPQDYRITEDDQIGVGGAKTKYKQNVAAIRLLRQLEAEGREATPEEQAVLVKYVGWGGLSQAFDYSNQWDKKSKWRKEYEELKDLLTPAEYEAARASTLNAHYTSPTVIKAMWLGVERLGFEGGRVMEPATGIGHFFGAMPQHLAENSQRLGTELDATTGKIAQQLYPKANIRVAGFEEAHLPNNFLDLAISNVPFGNYPVHDENYRGSKKFLTRSIHNYFFAKSLDKVKAGGVVAFVTSRFTMDSKNSQVREHLASQADLVGAIRLPNTAFKENAMTDVTTDILFLRKRAEGEAGNGTGWTQSVEQLDDEGREYRLNEYFLDNPDMMLGKMEVTGNFYRSSADLVSDGRDLSDALAEAIEKLPEGVAFNVADVVQDYPDTISQPPPFYKAPSASYADLLEGSLTVGDDGQVYRHLYGSNVLEKNKRLQSKNAVARISGMVNIRTKARAVLKANHNGADDATLATLQAELNEAYDSFVSEHGYISQRKNSQYLKDDPELPFLRSLEHYDEEDETATKAAIFSQRVVGAQAPPVKADTAHDALMISLNESGRINWERMSNLTGKDEADLRDELNTVLYHNPEGDWEVADDYLSGNVRAKLKAARSAAQFDARYERNVEALEKVVPTDIKPAQIKARLGVGWVDASMVADFINETLDVTGVEVRYIEEMGQWMLNKDKAHSLSYSHANNVTYATGDFDAFKLIEKSLNSRIAVVRDTVTIEGKKRRIENPEKSIAAQEMQSKLNQRFSEWLWEDDERANLLIERYNDTYNATVPRKYDGSHLTMPGLAANITLRPHQKDSIWRVVQGDNTLLAHQVGAGKTFTMIGAGMEMKRLGLRNKVMHVIPNHMLDQYAADFQKMYPGANVLQVSSKSLSKSKRQEMMSRIATDNWDAVIVSHSALKRLDVSDDTYNAFMQDQIRILDDYLNDPDLNDDKRTVKQIENAKMSLQARLREGRGTGKDRTLTWEDLGVDLLFVDEAHEFKNLYYPTRRSNLPGIGGGNLTDKSFDLFVKTQALQGDDKSVVFSTGTPISNTVGEMYTMQRFLQMDTLREQGLAHFDAWANQYGDTVTALEMKPAGDGYRMNTRFAKFDNVPELLRSFHDVADVKMDSDKLGIERPDVATGKAIPVAVPSSPELEAFIEEAAQRAAQIGQVDKRDDNMLNIITDAAKAALDMRLVDPDLPDNPDSKVNRLVENVYDIYERTTGVQVDGYEGPQNMAQVIFLDLGVPGSKSEFSVYQDIKDKLMARGVAEDEIAFIHDAKSDSDKLALFQRVNKGDTRVILGTTKKMGAGTNMQKRLAALHHVDVPWRPADIEQREGRILRQGNMNEEVEIYRYATEKSFDVYRWQVLETKAKFISQVMEGRLDMRSIEDLESVMSYAEMKAVATGNPALIRKLEVENEIRRIEALEAAHLAREHEMLEAARVLPGRIAKAKGQAKKLGDIGANYQQSGKAPLARIGERLAQEFETGKFRTTFRPVAEIYGATLSVYANEQGAKRARLDVGGTLNLDMAVQKSEKWNTTRLEKLVEKAIENKAAVERRVTEMEKRLASAEALVGQPFELDEDLHNLREELAELEAELDALTDDDDDFADDENSLDDR